MTISETTIQEALKWLARQNASIQKEIWKEAGYQNPETERKKLALAVLRTKDKLSRDKRKYSNREKGLIELEETTKLRIKSLKKSKKGAGRKSKLKRKIKFRIKLIEKLKNEENLGWRLIARYLEKYADLKISHSQLRRLYLQIKEEENKNV